MFTFIGELGVLVSDELDLFKGSYRRLRMLMTEKLVWYSCRLKG